ncbi:MAG: pyruvate kinase alpha/beta domain-containing protein, partial [Bacteroidota bacterium]
SLSWGVQAFYYDKEESLDTMFNDQVEILKEKQLLTFDDIVVHTGSTPIQEHLPTNMLKIFRVK